MDKSQSKAPCFLCGANSFEWFWLRGSQGHQITLQPQSQSAWTFFPDNRAMKARRCDNCGNILFFDAEFVEEN